MSQIFSTLSGLLGAAEKVQFTIEKAKGGKLSVLVVPILKDAPEELPAEQAQARAALALPLRLTESADKLDADFVGLLTRYRDQRQEVADDLDALARLKEASKNAKKAISKAGEAVAKDAPKASAADEDEGGGDAESQDADNVKGEVAPPAAAPAPAPATNPDSL